MIFDLNDLGQYFESRARKGQDPCAYGAMGSLTPDILYGQIISELKPWLNLLPSASILDIGCGTGELLSRLATEYHNTVGIDLSPAMVRAVTDKGYRAVVYDGGALPFDDGAFDVTLLYQVFINLPTADIARHLVREAARVTRQGGVIIVGAVPHPVRSRFPTHRQRHWVTTKILLRRYVSRRETIPYYSYDYRFFGDLFDAVDADTLTFVPCRVPKPGWDTKYHAIMVR